jgi:hypothetical protein
MSVISSNPSYILLIELIIPNKKLRPTNVSVNAHMKPPLTSLEWLKLLHFTYIYDFFMSEREG